MCQGQNPYKDIMFSIKGPIWEFFTSCEDELNYSFTTLKFYAKEKIQNLDKLLLILTS